MRRQQVHCGVHSCSCSAIQLDKLSKQTTGVFDYQWSGSGGSGVGDGGHCTVSESLHERTILRNADGQQLSERRHLCCAACQSKHMMIKIQFVDRPMQRVRSGYCYTNSVRLSVTLLGSAETVRDGALVTKGSYLDTDITLSNGTTFDPKLHPFASIWGLPPFPKTCKASCS